MQKRRQAASTLLAQTPSTTDATPTGCFSWLHGYEEMVVLIAEHTLHIPETSRKGLLLVEAVDRTSSSLLALSVCSRYLNHTLRSLGFASIQEAACRRATSLCPARWDTPTPFVCQFKEECTSARLVEFAKKATGLLAMHCASNHCLSVRRNVNLHLGKDLLMRVAVAHMAATRVAACSERSSAVLFCHQESRLHTFPRSVTSKWLALVDDRPGVWSPHSDIHVVSRVECSETVLSLAASHDGTAALATTDKDEVLIWRTDQQSLTRVKMPHEFHPAATWFYKAMPRLLLSSESIREPFHPEVLEVPSRARSAVVHVDTCGSIVRWSNEQHVIHTNARPDASGSLLLVVTLLRGRGASVRLLDTEHDSYEVVEEDPSRCGGELVATALSPRGDTCGVFCTGGVSSICNIFHRLSDSGWCLSSTVTLSSSPMGNDAWGLAPPLWSTPSSTHAAFSSCGSVLTFFSPRLTAGPRFGSITVAGAGEKCGVDLVATGSEHLPREVQFGPGATPALASTPHPASYPLCSSARWHVGANPPRRTRHQLSAS